MDNRFEMRLTGSGGQGVILGAIILAGAALMAGYETAQSQSYGPEARGGMCKAEVIVSKSKIGYPKVANPALLLALTQEALDKYSKGGSDKCTVIADSSLTLPEYLNTANVIHIPILDTATNVVGKSITANVVAIGAICSAIKFISAEHIREATLMQVPKAFAAMNLNALKAGMDLVAAKKEE